MDIGPISDLVGCERTSDSTKEIIISKNCVEERTPISSIEAEVHVHERYMRELYRVEELGDYALRLLDHEKYSNGVEREESKLNGHSASNGSTPQKGVGLLLEEIQARVHAITVGHKVESAERMDALKNHVKTCISNSIDKINRAIADFGEQMVKDLSLQQSEINDALLKSIQEYLETSRQNEGTFENLEKMIRQNVMSLSQNVEDFQLDTWSTSGSILQDLQASTNSYFQRRLHTLERTSQMRREISKMDDTIASLSKSRDIIQSKHIQILPAYWEKKMQIEDLRKSVQSKDSQLTRKLRRLEEEDFISPDSSSSKDIQARKIIRHKEKEMNRMLKNLGDACSYMAEHSVPEQKLVLQDIASRIQPVNVSDSLIHDYLHTLLITEQKYSQPDCLAAISQQYWASWLDQAFPLQCRQAMISLFKDLE